MNYSTNRRHLEGFAIGSRHGDADSEEHRVRAVKPQSDCITIATSERDPIGLKNVWQYRELLFFLTWRDVKVRYKQTILGAAWAIIQPVGGMIVLSVFFGHLGKVPSDGMPYPLFSIVGLVPWQFFAYAIAESSNSIVANERLITKVYFPRLVIPISATLTGLVDFAIAFVVLLVMLFVYGVHPTWAIATIPGFLVLAIISALGVGLWLSALNAQYRDVRHTLSFVIQIWLFVSPVAYSSSLVPPQWRFLYGLNPMSGVIEGFRWALLRKPEVPSALILASSFVAFLMLFSGLVYFRGIEKSFADVV